MRGNLLNKIVVFCLPGIGDAIQFTPALAELRRAFPQAQITVITMFQGTSDILSLNPNVNEVRCFDFFKASRRDGLRFIWGLRRERFDLSIMTFPTNRLEYNVVNRLVGRSWRAGYRYAHQSWENLWFLNNICVNEDPSRHNVEENLMLIRAVCERFGVVRSGAVKAQELKLSLTLSDEDEEYAREFLARNNLDPARMILGCHTYSSTFKNMHRKCWDKDNFVSLLRKTLDSDSMASVLIFSGPSDENVNRYIVEKLNSPRVVMVREGNLRRAAAVLKHCQVFVSNDSGLLHVAAACGVPVVGLYGPTNWQRLHPWTDRHTIVRASLPCMPCFYYSSRPLRCVANLDYACMREIPVEEVYNAVKQFLYPVPCETHA
jgi:heptosyltransferase II